MKYTIIGASGFIGRRLAAALQRDGHKVFTPRKGDDVIFNKDLGRLFYCAGLTADFAKNPAATVEAHAGLVAKLVERANFEHIVYLSSTRLYDALKYPIAYANMPLPMDPQNPRHFYDLTKAAGENICLTMAPGKSSVARLSGVFDWAEAAPGFLSEWMQRAANERAFTLDSTSGIVRDYIHLDDTIRILRKLMDEQVTGITNTASGENVSNAQIAVIFNAHGWNIKFARESVVQTLPACDISRLDELHVRPRRLSEVIESWIKERRKNETH